MLSDREVWLNFSTWSLVGRTSLEFVLSQGSRLSVLEFMPPGQGDEG